MVEIKLSVHQLVDFLLRTGDIDSRVFNNNTMLAGTKIHATYQSKQNNMYLREVQLSYDFHIQNYHIKLFGRADGIIVKNDKSVIIDEIKSTVLDLETCYEKQGDWHLGQAICYAFMYAKANNLNSIGINLTYISQNDESIMKKSFSFTEEYLSVYMKDLLKKYLVFYNIIEVKREKRNESANLLNFPFEKFRSGQRDLSKYCYHIASEGGILFAEAPTGIGKTMSTLFPFIKSFKDNVNEKIFYLTAKTSGREAAYKACELLKSNGQNLSEVIITAKDKICLNPGSSCNPNDCPFAVGYYDKIKDILTEMILNETSFDYETILKYAFKYNVCPFELQLDLSLYSDVVICDYNYLFDPIGYLKRYFDGECKDVLVLVDEAHNLVSRAKAMYSCEITYSLFKKVKRQISKINDAKIKSAFKSTNKYLKYYLDLYKEDECNVIIPYIEDSIMNSLSRLVLQMNRIQKEFSSYVTEEFKDCSMEIYRFIKLYEFYDESFKLFLNFENEKDFTLNLLCLDASSFVRKSLTQVKGSTLFSATLSPFDYYVEELGGDLDKDITLVLDSPFSKDNVLLMIDNGVSTLYKNREASYPYIVDDIKSFVKSRVGNYFVFFPSYEYMENVYNLLSGDFEIIKQDRNMDDKQKNIFLSNFENNPSKTTIGFVVLGGSFGEAIDLIDDRLIGVAIVGVGLPQLNFKSDLVKEYFMKKGMNGFDYAYVNRGINNVMQAMGRLIRSENDKGAILLIDQRYSYYNYRKIFKGNLKNYNIVYCSDDIEKMCQSFWRRHKIIE
ncbi:MAG: ATP-dependent DNA helicase [Bacilli bacterium]